MKMRQAREIKAGKDEGSGMKRGRGGERITHGAPIQRREGKGRERKEI